MKTHKQKPCGLVGDTVCGNFEEGDVVTNQSDNIEVTCPDCK